MIIGLYVSLIDPVGNERTVTLTGQPDQTAIARDMIQQMVADAQANERPGGGSGMGGGMGGGYGSHGGAVGGNTVTMRVPVSKVGLVIGRGGETIRDFEERSKAKILIASDSAGDNSSERVINLVGDDAATQMAKSMIEDIVYGNVRHLIESAVSCNEYSYFLCRASKDMAEVDMDSKEDTVASTVWEDLTMTVFSSLCLHPLLV